MNDDADVFVFSDRAGFRAWLEKNHRQENGIWIQFSKGSKQFTADDALKEAICFGWIDGLIKAIDDKKYKKYFSRRKDVHKWSEKNKAIYEQMVGSGLMTRSGSEVFQAEKGTGKPGPELSEKIQALRKALQENEEILALYDGKAPSRQKQMAGFYCEAKTDETRNKRKNKIIEALKNNYSGMLY